MCDHPLKGPSPSHISTTDGTSSVVLLVAREGGRLVKSLDVAVEDRPLRGGNAVEAFDAVREVNGGRGEPERVLALRAECDRVMAGRYTHTVEQVTGRTVVALLSQAHVDPDIMCSRRSSSTDGSGQRSPTAWHR